MFHSPHHQYGPDNILSAKSKYSSSGGSGRIISNISNVPAKSHDFSPKQIYPRNTKNFFSLDTRLMIFLQLVHFQAANNILSVLDILHRVKKISEAISPTFLGILIPFSLPSLELCKLVYLPSENGKMRCLVFMPSTC